MGLGFNSEFKKSNPAPENGGDDLKPPQRPNFEMGDIYITPSAAAAIPHADVQEALRRHSLGDWGNLDEEDKRENERALRDGTRLLSSFSTGEGSKFWIITEADRSSTTILLPSDY